MPAEQFANLAETSLGSSYTSGGTTLSVTSSSGFPTHGPFRVRIGNSGKTIWRVDVVFGTTWYGGAEFNDANANSADTVTLVWTEASGERLIQTAEPGDRANPSGVSGGDYYSQFGGFKVVPLDQSNWTWFNQGSASVNQRGKLVNLTSPTAGGTNLRGRLRGSYPTTPFTITVVIQPYFQSAGNISGLGLLGFTVSDGTKHKILVASNFNFNTANPPPSFWVAKYASATSATSATVIDSMPSAAQTIPIWLKMTDDGTNQTFYFSFDGVNFTQILQEARTTHLTPSDIGIVMGNQSGSQTVGGNFLSWEILPYVVTEITPLGGSLTVTGQLATRSP